MDQAMVNHHDQTRNREEAPVLEVPKSVAYSKTDPQLLTISPQNSKVGFGVLRDYVLHEPSITVKQGDFNLDR